MKRTCTVLVAACALLLTLEAGPAFADGLLPSVPSGAAQSVSNGTDQSNEAVAVNVPIASGNNVALVNGGDQNASAGTNQSQENENATGQSVSQSDGSAHSCGCAADRSVSNSTGQENEAVTLNAPIASGNNVALVNRGDQNTSAGTSQSQQNENATGQNVQQNSGPASGGSDPTVRNRTEQENEAVAVNVPIASGNNVALVNKGDQSASAGTSQSQEDENATRQNVHQNSGGGSDESVRNRTGQENEAAAVNVPIASGNNMALVNCGHQAATAGTSQSQENENATWQNVWQTSSGGTSCHLSRCEPHPCREVTW